MFKWILILGGGFDQVPSIKEARSLGFNTLVVDYDTNCPGKDLCDCFLGVSNRDTEAIARAIAETGIEASTIAGIFVIGADIPHIAAELALKLGVYYPIPYAAAHLMTDKLLMKKHFEQENIPVCSYLEISNFSDLKRIIYNEANKAIDFVLKPRDSSGARGVFLVSDQITENKLEVLFEESFSVTSKPTLLLEVFAKGAQISSETLIVDSKAATIGFALRNYEHIDRFSPSIIENGGIQPYPPLFRYRAGLNQQLEKLAASLDITNGIIKGDLVFDPETNSFRFIEVALRMSGGNFAADIIPLSTGYNFITNAIRLFTGGTPEPFDEDYYECFVANRYFFDVSHSLPELTLSCTKPNWLLRLEQTKQIGIEIDKITCHADRSGCFVVQANNVSELNERIEFIYQHTNCSR